MKTKSLSFLAAITFYTAALAVPINPFSFNTAALPPAFTGFLPYGSPDARWEVAETGYVSGALPPITGYIKAVSVNPAVGPGWPMNGVTNGNWVTYPHASCGTSISDHYCAYPNGVDQWYKIEFDITCESYCMNMDMWADNAIAEIFINTNTNSGPGYWYNAAPAGNWPSYQGWEAANVVSRTNCFQTGHNYMIVHVISKRKAGAPDYDYAGLLVNVTSGDKPCEEVVQPPTGCCLGNLCTDSQNALTGNYEVPLNNFDFNFSGNGNDKVNVGYNCSTEGIGKLNSMTSVQTNQSASASPESVSIYGNNAFSNFGTGVGVMGVANNQISDGGTGKSIGVWGDATGAGNNTGGRFFAGDTRALMANRYNIGVSAVALPSNGMAPAYSYLSSYAGANIGIYAAGVPNNSRDGGPAGRDWAAWFDGDVKITGNCFWNTSFQFSDKRFKKDIKPIESVSERIQKLNGYTYSFRTDEFKERLFDNKSHMGLIAQEVKEVFPELVTIDSKGFYAVDYQGMIPVLLEAAKAQAQITTDQKVQIEKQQQQIDELKTLVQTFAGNTTNTGSKTTSIPVNLSDKNTVVLNQNVPNPFAESTVISYNIPSDFTKAQILFTSTEGKIIKAVDITVKGVGSLTVFANDLTHGVYTYALVIDGKTIDTKKMVKE